MIKGKVFQKLYPKKVGFERDPSYGEGFGLRKSRTKGFEKERRVKSHESCFEKGRVGL